MTPTDPKTPTEKPTDESTDRQTNTDGVPLLAAAVASREILQDVDPATVDDAQESHLINALEALDNLYLKAPTEELAAAIDTDVEAADPTGDSTMIDESTEITIESNAETIPAADLDVDLENADDPLNDLRAAIAEREEPAWNVTTLVEIDTETAERFRPAFRQALADPDEQFLDLIDNYAATDAQVTIHGYDPEYYFENRSEDVRDHWLTMDIMDALRDADEPLDWEDLVDATDVDDATLDSKISELQEKYIVAFSGRGGGFVLHKDYTRDNDDV